MMSSGGGHSCGYWSACGAISLNFCNDNLDKLSATEFNFPLKCFELTWKLFTAAVHVNVLISFIIGKHFERPFLL